MIKYIFDNKIKDRFVWFFNISKDQSASLLSDILLTGIKSGNKFMY